jgi:hypothetical protein
LLAVSVLATTVFVLLAVMDAHGTPIHPDVREVILAQQQPAPQFSVARAGWQGTEMKAAAPQTTPAADIISGAATVRMVRASLRAAAIPSPWEIAAIVLAILLLRRIKQVQTI